MNKIKLALSVLAMAAAVNVYAHGMMTMTYPKDGAMLMDQAGRIELNFQNPMKVVSLKIVDSIGKPVAINFDRNGHETMRFQTTVPMLSPDNYTVHWKAMGEDGHMMKGSYGFMQH